MSFDHQERLVSSLEKLGLSRYQARVFSSLISNGPSSVGDLQRSSAVPRTKIYEVLEQLSKLGAIQYKSGRPVIYDALQPSILVEHLKDDYLGAADDASRLMSEVRNSTKNGSANDLVWTVKGKMAVRRKAASTIESAKRSVLMIESYPPKLILSTSSILKAGFQRKLVVKVFCILKEGQVFAGEEPKSKDFIEYRKISRAVRKDATGLSEQLLVPMRGFLSRVYCLIIADDSEAFISLPNNRNDDDSKNLGVTLKVPGLPYVQRILFERIVHNATSRL